jgi:hypothetical protein
LTIQTINIGDAPNDGNGDPLRTAFDKTNQNFVELYSNMLVVDSPSKEANGYVWLPNDVLLQWGTVTANTTTGNATFSVAFPTACQSVTLSVIGSANVAYQLAAPNTTVATIRTSSTTTAISVEYMAVGY